MRRACIALALFALACEEPAPPPTSALAAAPVGTRLGSYSLPEGALTPETAQHAWSELTHCAAPDLAAAEGNVTISLSATLSMTLRLPCDRASEVLSCVSTEWGSAPATREWPGPHERFTATDRSAHDLATVRRRVDGDARPWSVELTTATTSSECLLDLRATTGA